MEGADFATYITFYSMVHSKFKINFVRAIEQQQQQQKTNTQAII